VIFQDIDAANAKGVKSRERCIKYYSTDTMAVILSDVIAGLS